LNSFVVIIRRYRTAHRPPIKKEKIGRFPFFCGHEILLHGSPRFSALSLSWKGLTGGLPEVGLSGVAQTHPSPVWGRVRMRIMQQLNIVPLAIILFLDSVFLLFYFCSYHFPKQRGRFPFFYFHFKG
jgi:hypothetical protein